MCVRNLWNWPVFFFFFFLVAGVFLLCNWPDYTSNETGPHALFEYLNTVAPPQGSTLGPLYKLLLDLSLPPPSEGPSCFNFFIRDWPCLQPPPPPQPLLLPCATVPSARPEWSGRLLNTRPLGATSPPSAGMAEMLAAEDETGILPQQWAFARQHVTFHSIQSSKTWLGSEKLTD